jgi:hypothetical protein
MQAFLLTRYFTVLSLVLIGLAGGVLEHYVHQLESAQLLRMAEDRNVGATRIFSNVLWADFSPLVGAGVDVGAQLAFLQAHGCEQIQGFFFGKPQPPDQFATAWREKSS